jgi:hypothetical protein
MTNAGSLPAFRVDDAPLSCRTRPGDAALLDTFPGRSTKRSGSGALATRDRGDPSPMTLLSDIFSAAINLTLTMHRANLAG